MIVAIAIQGVCSVNKTLALNGFSDYFSRFSVRTIVETIKGLDEAFLRVVENHTAGSPMDESIKWTHLTRQQIADRLASDESIGISVTVVDQLLKKHQFRRRQALKRKATGSNPKRNEQFEKIHALVETYQAAGEPVISMDTKKRS